MFVPFFVAVVSPNIFSSSQVLAHSLRCAFSWHSHSPSVCLWQLYRFASCIQVQCSVELSPIGGKQRWVLPFGQRLLAEICSQQFGALRLQNHSWWYQTTWSPQISRIQSLTILIPETNWQTYRMKCLLKALKLWSVDLGPKNPFKSISRISYSHLSYSQVVWVWHQRSNLNMNGAQQILVAWLLDHTQCYVFKIEFSRIYPLPLDLRIFLIFTKIPVMISFPVVWYWLETLRRKPCTIFASAPWSWQLQPMAIWTIWCQPPWVVWHAACVSPANWIATFERSQWSLTEVIGNKIKLFSYWTSKCWVSRRVEVMHHRSCTKL